MPKGFLCVLGELFVQTLHFFTTLKAHTTYRGTVSRQLEMGVFGTQGLPADVGEADHELGVVAQRLDADDAADAELRVPHAHAWLQREPGRLILVLVGI